MKEMNIVEVQIFSINKEYFNKDFSKLTPSKGDHKGLEELQHRRAKANINRL
jgi:hypothetical protein